MSRQFVGLHELLFQQDALQRCKPALIIVPRTVAQIVRLFPFANRGNQLLAKVFPIKVAGSRERQRNAERAAPNLGETQFPVEPRWRILLTEQVVTANCSKFVCMMCKSPLEDDTALLGCAFGRRERQSATVADTAKMS